ASALQRKTLQRLSAEFYATLSPVRFERKSRRIAAICCDFHDNAAGFLCNSDCLAEREGFYFPSFRKLRRYLDFNDIILHSCVFQADSQSTFRVLPSTSGYSQHHEKPKNQYQ